MLSPKNLPPYLIDEYPILAIAASQAKGVTTMKDLAELRFKESDRLTSIHENLLNSGVDKNIIKDDLERV